MFSIQRCHLTFVNSRLSVALQLPVLVKLLLIKSRSIKTTLTSHKHIIKTDHDIQSNNLTTR